MNEITILSTRQPIVGSARQIMVFDWLERWLKSYARSRVGDSTYNTYRCAIVKLKQVMTDIPINDVIELDLQEGIHVLCDLGYSKSSLHTLIVVLNMAFHKAVKNRLIMDNPSDDLFIPKTATQKRVKALTIAQQASVEKACREVLHGKLFLFLLLTGIRRSELCNLEWDDYDGENIHIRVSKTHNGIRTIPLLPAAKKIVDTQPHSNEYIFNSTLGTPITASVLKKTYHRLRNATGILTLTNHVCRHTFATRLIESGVEPKALSALLGHSSAAFTLSQYGHAQYEHIRKQIFLLDK